MRELSPNWCSTARALKKSEKLELSEDGMKVRRKLPLTPFISTIKSIKSVLVTSNEELTVSGITLWLATYGEIVYVQVIKPGMEIPENLRIYCARHSELGTRPVGVVEFETPEAAHRCCRELDSRNEGETRVCLLGTRIRSFTRHRRKKDPGRGGGVLGGLGGETFDDQIENVMNEKGINNFNQERFSPVDSNTDSAISEGDSSCTSSSGNDSGVSSGHGGSNDRRIIKNGNYGNRWNSMRNDSQGLISNQSSSSTSSIENCQQSQLDGDIFPTMRFKNHSSSEHSLFSRSHQNTTTSKFNAVVKPKNTFQRQPDQQQLINHQHQLDQHALQNNNSILSGRALVDGHGRPLVGGVNGHGGHTGHGINLGRIQTQQQIILQEKLLAAARLQYHHALVLAQQQQQQRILNYQSEKTRSFTPPPPPGLEVDTENTNGGKRIHFSDSSHTRFANNQILNSNNGDIGGAIVGHGGAIGPHGGAIGAHGGAIGVHGTAIGGHGGPIGSHGTIDIHNWIEKLKISE